MGTECQQARDRSIVCKRQVNNARTVFLLRIKGRSTDARTVHTSQLKRKYTLTTMSFYRKNFNLIKGLASFTQLVKVRRGKLVMALPSIRLS